MRPLLGTFVEIAATGDPLRLPSAVAAAFAAVARVQRLMSFHDSRSDVSRINGAPCGESVPVDAETHAVLRAALEFGERSGGAFDVAIAPVLVRRGVLPALGASMTRGDEEPREATYRDLELRARSRVRWRRRGWIDLGGIAKGYAVDRAVETLRAHGIESGIVNAGGDLRCFGEPQPLYLRADDDPGALRLAGELRDGAAATSGDTFRSDALIDPARGAGVTWGRSITVLARDCLHADALTKVVRLAPDVAPRVLAHFDAMEIGVPAQ